MRLRVVSTPRRPVTVARAVLAVAREEHVTASAAGLAYYAFASLVPLGLLAFALVSLLGTFAPVARALELVTGVGAAQFEATFERVASDAAGRTRAVVLAAAIFAWSGLRLVRGVAGLFREVYGTRRDDGLVRRFLDSLLVLGTVVGGLTLLGAVAVALSVRVSGLAWSLLAPLLLFVALAVAFLPMYYVLPGTRVTVREAAPGAALAAGAWTLLGLVFRWYVTTAESVHLYGVAGAVLVVLSWLYVGGLALLVGVVLNSVLAGRVAPDEEWLPG